MFSQIMERGLIKIAWGEAWRSSLQDVAGAILLRSFIVTSANHMADHAPAIRSFGGGSRSPPPPLCIDGHVVRQYIMKY